MASTKRCILPLLCLVLTLAHDVMATAAFETLLQRIEAARAETITMETNTATQKTNLNNNAPTSSDFATAATAITYLNSLITTLTTNQVHLDAVSTQAQDHMDLINPASASAFPYTSNTNLAPVLSDAKVKAITFLTAIKTAADDASTRYTEIISDMNLEISNINNAAPPDLSAVVSNAHDEAIEAVGENRLDPVATALTEAKVDFLLRLQNVATQLLAITPSPAFSTYLNTFISTYG